MNSRPLADPDAKQASEVLIAACKRFLNERFSELDAAFFQPDNLMREAFVKDPFMVSQIFVAEEDGRMFGVVTFTAAPYGLGCLDWIWVDPACHNRGVGTLQMARAEEFWQEHQQRKTHTCVAVHDKQAILYYLKHDSVRERCCRDHFRPGVDAIILGRFLKDT